jgi:hypothetical protein
MMLLPATLVNHNMMRICCQEYEDVCCVNEIIDLQSTHKHDVVMQYLNETIDL